MQALRDIHPAKSRCIRCGTALLRMPWAVGEPVCEDCHPFVFAPPVEAYLLRCEVPSLHRRVLPIPWDVRARVYPETDLYKWDGTPWCVTLAGVVGGGKTTAAVALLAQAAAKLRWPAGARFARAAPMSLEILREQRRDIYRQMVGAPVLVLDDLGRYDRVWEICADVLTGRHERGLPTIVTTNLRVKTVGDDQGLADIDPALYRRLAEGVFVGFTTPWSRKQ